MARHWPGNTTTDYLTIPASSVWVFNTNICVMAIVKPSTFTAGEFRRPCGIGSIGLRGWTIGMDDTGTLFQQGDNAGSVFATSATQLAAGNWYGILFSFYAAANRLFKRYTFSGDVVAPETVTSSVDVLAPQATDADNHIGQSLSVATASNSWAGDIDRVLIGQGTTPSDAEFQAWCKFGTVPPSLTVKGHWLLSGNSPETDLSGNGLHATVTGTTVVAGPNDAPPQFARPTTDTTRVNWEDESGGTTNIYQHIDEATADDNDLIRTRFSPVNDVYVTKLSVVVDPLVSTGHILRYRYGKNAVSGQQIDQTVEFRINYVSESSLGTLIHTEVHTNVGPYPIAAAITLTGSETDAILTAAYNGELYARAIGNAP